MLEGSSSSLLSEISNLAVKFWVWQVLGLARRGMTGRPAINIGIKDIIAKGMIKMVGVGVQSLHNVCTG